MGEVVREGLNRCTASFPPGGRGLFFTSGIAISMVLLGLGFALAFSTGSDKLAQLCHDPSLRSLGRHGAAGHGLAT